MTDSDSDIELNEESERQSEFQKLYNNADDEFEKKKREEGMKLFKEDWQLSQFWYSDKTAETLAEALVEGANEDTVIAIVSAPSVYAAILKLDPSKVLTEHIYLFEFDKRFELLAGKEHFFFYDFANPTEFDDKLKGKVDRLLIDPPFLNENCQKKCMCNIFCTLLFSIIFKRLLTEIIIQNASITAHTLLAKNDGKKTRHGVEKHRLISCTGERMANIIKEAYPDTRITNFYPEHGNGLSNEFRCYANFECSQWKFLE
ncbi:hypothetical protein Kpol_1062p54 [Vanderwaltozyma polyspora DSM 70294]|uniref:Elongation factor methyltransferase 5 n=1 Tax=Vanderwaltozyma polyspora (strain ATCC 22028 / DSM 70294 / BCRC 21397 / CBS 2163 / NBRC 10782 / NRRL Y-8283 / UCD 57-17) TaxID=436907 RepID=A7TKA9_VANPO|nr:LOW QUALITY PROTEIN: uncharacterized protein Kpol_1062p54 [Vanderwaltozyma polyspora DSM 70294]EDO17344.1 hypothetical protein Kpol_1062p54 [Vanderwaltozyma polyspora DSM 70294]